MVMAIIMALTIKVDIYVGIGQKGFMNRFRMARSKSEIKNK
jgi:hypothetical protein